MKADNCERMNSLAELKVDPVVAEFEAHVEVPNKQYVEKYVEVPEIEYVDVPFERIVEVPVVVEREVEKIVQVPKYRKIPVPRYHEVEEKVDVNRKIPVPVEADIECQVRAGIRCDDYANMTYKIRLPRFIEVPVPRELIEDVDETEELNRMLLDVVNSSTARDPEEISRLVSEIASVKQNVLISKSNLASKLEAAFESDRIMIE